MAQRLCAEIWQAVFRLATVTDCTLPLCMPIYTQIRLVSPYFNHCLVSDPAMWTTYEFLLVGKFEPRDDVLRDVDDSRYHQVLFALWMDCYWQLCIERSGSLSLDIKIRLQEEHSWGKLDYTLVAPNLFALLPRCHSFSYRGDGRVWWNIMPYFHNSKTLKTLDLRRHLGTAYDDYEKIHCVVQSLTRLKLHEALTTYPVLRAPNLRFLELHDIHWQVPLEIAIVAFKSMSGVEALTVDEVMVDPFPHSNPAQHSSDKSRSFMHFPRLRVFRFIPTSDIYKWDRELQAELFCGIVDSNPSLRAIQIQYTPHFFPIISGSNTLNSNISLKWLSSPRLQSIGISGRRFYIEKGGRPVLRKSLVNLTKAIAKCKTTVKSIRFGCFRMSRPELEEMELSASNSIRIECVNCKLLT